MTPCSCIPFSFPLPPYIHARESDIPTAARYRGGMLSREHKSALCIGAAFAFANGKLQPPLPSESVRMARFFHLPGCVSVSL